MTTYESLRSTDFRHVWHPFTQTSVWTEEDPLIVESAEGFELIDVNGKRYLDGVSSLWCNVHGHSEPRLLRALHEQADKLCHSTLLGLSHRPLLELTDALLNVLPPGLTRVFYADSGSAAVEAGLRICLEWWQKQENPRGKERKKLISLEEAYHGDTIGAVGVGYSSYFHEAIAGSIIPAFRFQSPHFYRFYQGKSIEEAEEQSLEDLKNLLAAHGREVAGFIVEPLMQGAAGMWPHSPRFLDAAVALCREHEILVIFDEVATGFGKSGKVFASQLSNVIPDILIMGKGLTAGYLPLSAAVTREDIFDAFTGAARERKTFFYGQTYAGNPLACAVAAANLSLFEENGFMAGVLGRIEYLGRELEEKIAPLPQVGEVRRLGMMTGIELTSSPGEQKPYPSEFLAGQRIVREARARGVCIRPLGNVLILMPAIGMPEKDLTRLVHVTVESIRAALS